MNRLLIAIMLSFISLLAEAASVVTVGGTITDTDGRLLSGITVRLFNGKRPLSFGRSGSDGSFSLKTDTLSFPVNLIFTSQNHAKKEISVDKPTDSLKVILEKEVYELREVIVKAPHTRVKGDTITYDVSAFTSKADRNIEDVIKKLPGVSVDESGNIYYAGETINKFYIEGLDLMGSNYAVASRNISPDDISSISVYERHQPKRVLKDVVNSNKAALNLKLKKGSMLKPVGYVKGGAGYGDNTLWSGNLYGMLISPENQTIISAAGNNSGKIYADPKSGKSNSVAYGIFSNMPFGSPSIPFSRYLKNKSASFSANTLFKLNKNTTFKVNASYILEHDRYTNYSSTDYLATDNGTISFKEAAVSALRYKTVSTGLKLENNSDSFYLSEELSFKGRFNDNGYEVDKADPLSQHLRNHNFRLSNIFKTIIRRKDKVYEINSRTWLDNTPLNFISARDMNKDSMIVDQSVKGLSFHNDESTSFSWMAGFKVTIGAAVDFSFDYDKLRSAAIAANSFMPGNDISGHKIRTSVSPFVKYKIKSNLTWRSEIPVRLYNIAYTDLLTSERYRHDRPYVDFNTSLIWKANLMLYIELSAGWRHSIGGITNFIENPIYTTYRNQTTLGNGSLKKGRTDYVKCDFNLRNPSTGFYVFGMAGFNMMNNNSISVFNATVDGTSNSSLKIKNKENSSNVMITVSKDMREWNTLFSINATGMWVERKNMRALQEYNIHNDIYIIGGKIETSQFSDILVAGVDCSYSYTRQSFGNTIPSMGLDEISFNGNLSIFPFPFLELYCKLRMSRNELTDSGYKNNLFLDGGIRAKINKFELELSGNNLTNIKKYEYSVYRNLDISTLSYNLRPIEGILTLRYNF